MEEGSAVVDSIMVVGVLTHCAFLLSVCGMKTAQINVQRNSLIQEFMFYEFELGHDTEEATKNIFVGKVKVQCSKQMFQKFCLGCENFDDQARSDRPKTMYSMTVLQPIDKNPVCSTRRVSGELGLSLCKVVHDLIKSIRSCQIVPYATKIL